jgi:hypothetical protein
LRLPGRPVCLDAADEPPEIRHRQVIHLQRSYGAEIRQIEQVVGAGDRQVPAEDGG